MHSVGEEQESVLGEKRQVSTSEDGDKTQSTMKHAVRDLLQLLLSHAKGAKAVSGPTLSFIENWMSLPHGRSSPFPCGDITNLSTVLMDTATPSAVSRQ